MILGQSPDDLYSYVQQSANPDLRHKYSCSICGKTGLHRADVRNHVENIHFPGIFEYSCKLCNTIHKSKTALVNHKALRHKNVQHDSNYY